MEDNLKVRIDRIYRKQKDFFNSQETKDPNFRIKQLKKLKAAINGYEDKILHALWKDLRKSKEEAYLTEIGIVTGEIDYHLKNLKKWSGIQKVPTPLHLLPSRSSIYHEPLGVGLIIAPWNYPFQLLMNPLVGAISAGCCAVLKPSEFTTHIAAVMQELISETFEENYIAVVQGGPEVGQELLQKAFDMIFFTGSTRVGKIVMKAAAENLTPVVLELGGKSPCIVDYSANLNLAAKRIAWGKTINAGQTCIAPDYLVVHDSIKDELIEKISAEIEKMFGKDVRQSEYYPRIVNENTYSKLANLLENTRGNIRYGGAMDKKDLFINPTIIDNVNAEDITMQEEIFGPVLPVMTFKDIEETIQFINSREKPLALYYFGEGKTAKNVLKKTSSGGVSINDTLMHITNHHLPFGGVGHSGFGKYHGRESFLIFSNQRAVVKTPTWIDLPFKYVPFKNFRLTKKLF